MVEPRQPDAAELDALRRRLYRPDSTEADLRRYSMEQSAVAPEPAVETAAARSRLRVPRLLPAAALAVAVVVAVVVALTVSLGQLRALRPPARIDATASDVPVLVEDIGDGATLTVPQRESITSGPASVSVDGAAVVGQRFEGSGNAVLVVNPPSGAMHGGVASVLLTSGGPIPVAWRALAAVYLGRWTPVHVVLARGASAEPPGAPTAKTFRYRDAPPTRIAVIAPQGVRWSVLVGVAGPEPSLH